MITETQVQTLLHIKEVAKNLMRFAAELLARAQVHDESKLSEPELSMFDKFTGQLKEKTYGSEEYREMLAGLGPALQHHYENNSHHPEHYEGGVAGMNLFDLVEMYCDWEAAVKRHNDGDMYKSIEHNATRFGMDAQLVSIFHNTRRLNEGKQNE